MFRSINSIAFNRKFKNNEDCYLYLIEKNGAMVMHARGVGVWNVIREEHIITGVPGMRIWRKRNG